MELKKANIYCVYTMPSTVLRDLDIFCVTLIPLHWYDHNLQAQVTLQGHREFKTLVRTRPSLCP